MPPSGRKPVDAGNDRRRAPDTAYWKAFCDESTYPGLWSRWFSAQCVAVGWGPPKWSLNGGGSPSPAWSAARKALLAMKPGDYVVVQLAGHRVGRIGQIVTKRISDRDWDPLVRFGEQSQWDVGRRVEVRWDLELGPADPQLVVRLPMEVQLNSGELRGTLKSLPAERFDGIREAMGDESNWVSVTSRFAHESSLSDFIATFPHRLEDGLVPHPSKEVREMFFPDGTRADVILLDRDGRSVVVECKQGAPLPSHVEQVRGYRRHLEKETGHAARSILVHGGASKLTQGLRDASDVEFVQYRLGVDFVRCR